MVGLRTGGLPLASLLLPSLSSTDDGDTDDGDTDDGDTDDGDTDDASSPARTVIESCCHLWRVPPCRRARSATGRSSPRWVRRGRSPSRRLRLRSLRWPPSVPPKRNMPPSCTTAVWWNRAGGRTTGEASGDGDDAHGVGGAGAPSPRGPEEARHFHGRRLLLLPLLLPLLSTSKAQVSSRKHEPRLSEKK